MDYKDNEDQFVEEDVGDQNGEEVAQPVEKVSPEKSPDQGHQHQGRVEGRNMHESRAPS